ncbi:MAG: hypothetical protein H6623_01410 [Bdellovibrionaceae bacterium]|nr:hypothetical protein [Pseudobdellovibrionaceae bacterium]
MLPKVSKMNRTKICLILVLFSALSCSKVNPDFDTIDSDKIPQPLFLGSSVKQIYTASDSITFDINGECDPKISNLKGSATGSSTTISSVRDLSVSDIKMNCTSNKKFSFELKSLAALGYTVSENAVYEIQLVGVTSAGDSKPSKIIITYSSALGGKRNTVVTSGGTGGKFITDGTANGFKAKVRISDKSNSPIINADDALTKTDGTTNGFKAHMGIRINN